MISFIEIYPNIVKRGNSCCLFGLKEKNKFTPNMMHDTTSNKEELVGKWMKQTKVHFPSIHYYHKRKKPRLIFKS